MYKQLLFAAITLFLASCNGTSTRRNTTSAPAQHGSTHLPETPASDSTEVPDGPQRYDFDDGFFIGETKDGKPHGKGTYFYNDGNWVDGNYIDGGLYGQATQYYADQKRTDKGEYDNGSRVGRGRMEWENGDWYEGDWNNHGRHGQGTYYNNETQRTDRGQYKDDRRYGHVVMTWDDGHKYEGTWSDDEQGKLNGIGTLYFPDGTAVKGRYINGKWQKD
ncbi:MAG: hypothetical protein LBR06_04285 [Bacteroidales bacterium]|jgi:hypothetical protein|nr:hypothetical protein [Bacteroidales bacterium]